MANIKKKKNIPEFDISKFNGTLNFAYCPSSALVIDKHFIQKSSEFSELSKGLDKKSIELMANAMRYFYICYSLKMDDNPLFKRNTDYFYFQLFSQIGDQQTASQPIYGFYTEEKILDLIKDIDSMFEPDIYDKCIFDTFQNEMTANADQLIKLMQEWTNLKLLNFNQFYFSDNIAIENLYKLIQRGRKTELKKQKNTKTNNVKKQVKKSIAKKISKTNKLKLKNEKEN